MRPHDHPAAIDPDALLAACEVRRSRGSGPGGQHRNKVETAIAIRHRPTGVSGSASERRSQAENRSVALFRLRVNLAIHVRSPITTTYEPSDLWRSRVAPQRPRRVPGMPAGFRPLPVAGHIRVNPTHTDYPGLLAEALDVLAHLGWDPKLAADLLGVSPSQLVKFIKDEPAALERVNRERSLLALHALK